MHIGQAENRRVAFLPWNEQIPVPGIGPLDFEMFPYQREWYSDEQVYAKILSMMKGTQTGASEWLMRWTIFFPDTRGDKALYVFPAQRQLRDFSDQRTKPLIEGSPYLKSRIPSGYIDNKLLKQIGFGFVNFRGSRNPSDLDSIPAGEVAFD